MPPCVVYVCWWERPIQSTILQTQCFTQGGLLAPALHNTGRHVTSKPLTMNNTPFLTSCLALRRKQERPNRPVGRFTDLGEIYWKTSCGGFLFSWLNIWLNSYLWESAQMRVGSQKKAFSSFRKGAQNNTNAHKSPFINTHGTIVIIVIILFLLSSIIFLQHIICQLLYYLS